MKVSDFLLSLYQQGITVQVEQEKIKINAPEGALSPEIQNQLREGYAEIIAFLLDEQVAGYMELPLRRADRSQPIPASSSQRGLWLQYQLEGMSSTYNVPCVYHLRGELNHPAIEKALKYLIARHESLRMSFKARGGEPYLVIADSVTWGLDIRCISGEAVERELAEQAARPFNLEQAPLFRAHLWTDFRNDHTLLLNFHHIIIDEWAKENFERELSSVYVRIVSGEEAALPPLELDFADYAAWQHESMESARFTQGLNYWKKNMIGAPELLELPCDLPRSVVQSYIGDKVKLELEQALVVKLQELARREQVTLFMVMSLAFALLLGRYSRQEDVIIGSPMANRSRKVLEGVVGFFVNTLPLRFDLSGNPTLPEMLRRVKKIALDAYEHQDVPFDKLIEGLRIRRDTRNSPVFQALFTMKNMSKQDLHLGECVILNDEVNIGVAKFEMSLFVDMQMKDSRLELEYNKSIFKAATAARMLVHYKRILEWIVSTPKKNFHEFDFLSAAERQQILVEWNDTSVEYPREKCIHQLFEEYAENVSDIHAIKAADQVLTYRQLNDQANQLAHFLCEMGIGPENGVGLYIERSCEMIVSLLAILKAGGAYVPLDMTFPRERQAFILRDTHSTILLTLRRHLTALPDFNGKVICVDDYDLYTQKSKKNPDIVISPENLAYIMYTSGSTGIPKGVCIPHRAVVRLVKNTNYVNFSSGEVFLQFAPLAFDASTFEIWGSLLNGAKLVIFPPHLPLLDELECFVKTNGVTTLWLTSGLFHQVMESQPGIVNGLHQLLSGGDVLSPSHVRIALQQNPNCCLINSYGPTENTTFTCCYTIKKLSLQQSVPIGRPIANTVVYILDKHSQPVPVGVVGELYIGGDGLARQYLNQPDLSEQKFVPNPFRDQAGKILYRTGDLVRWLPDGNIEFLGRMDDQVKIRGYRIELGEIEAVLKENSEVLQAVTLMREDQLGDKRLVAYIIPTTGAIVDAEKLHSFLQKKLPDYMIPSAFVQMDGFPLTVNGKIDRKAFPPPEIGLPADHYLSPRNEIETRLVSIWEEILGIKHVGIRDNFFVLGGHSLLAVRLLTLIQEEFGQSLPLNILFQAGTIEAIAETIAHNNKTDLLQGITLIQPEGAETPLFLLEPGLHTRDLVNALAPERPVYGLFEMEDGEMVSLKSFQNIAEDLYHNLVNFYPQGPYLILGHSAHGYTALELARLLIQTGRKVAFLGLLDTYPPGKPSKLKKRLDFHIYNLKDKNLPEILLYIGNLVNHFSIYWSKKLLDQLNQKNMVPLQKAEKIEPIIRIAHNYKPRPFKGPVTIFSTAKFFGGRMDPMNAWAKTITGQLNIVPVPGDHMSMLKFPQAAVLAEKIKEQLQSHEDG